MPKKPEFNSKTLLLINIVCLQVAVVFLNNYWSFMAEHGRTYISSKTITSFSLIAGVFLGLTAIYLINEIIRLAKNEREFRVNHVHLEESKDLINVLRSHRHDFLNHLQVIMGLIQMNRSDSAIKYIKEVTGALTNESTINNVKHLEVAALLLKKKAFAEEKGIRFNLNLQSDLSGLNIPATDLSRILGNLIDNAAAAVEGLNEEHKEIWVSFGEDDRNFSLQVANKKPIIPENLQAKIFEKGFTTKGAQGSGLGLYIVKQLAEKHGGTVNLASNEETGTVFTVLFLIISGENALNIDILCE